MTIYEEVKIFIRWCYDNKLKPYTGKAVLEYAKLRKELAKTNNVN